MHAHKILLHSKPKLKNVETNMSNRWFLSLPNPKTIDLIQCQFLFSLGIVSPVLIKFFDFMEPPIKLTL